MKISFEVVGRVVFEGGVPAFGIVMGDVVADLEPGFGQAEKGAAIEQFGLEAAPKRFGVGVILAVAQPAIALQRPAASEQLLKADSRVLAFGRSGQ